MPRRRELQQDEVLSDKTVAEWVAKRLDDGRLIVIFSLEKDGSDATMHCLCNADEQPLILDTLDVLGRVIEAAKVSVRQ